MSLGSKILIFLLSDSISDRTLAPCRRLCSNKANVPADLQSVGNEYQDLFNPITSYLTSPYIFNAKLSLDFSLLTS